MIDREKVMYGRLYRKSGVAERLVAVRSDAIASRLLVVNPRHHLLVSRVENQVVHSEAPAPRPVRRTNSARDLSPWKGHPSTLPHLLSFLSPFGRKERKKIGIKGSESQGLKSLAKFDRPLGGKAIKIVHPPGGKTIETLHLLVGKTIKTLHALRGKPIGIWVALVVLGGLSAGCRESQPQSADTKPAIEQTAERGPIRLKVTLDKDKVAVAEPFSLLVEVASPEGFQVRLPAIDDPKKIFQVRSAKELPSLGANGAHQWREVYQIESLTSGDHELPPITIHYRGFKAGSATQPAASQTSSSSQPATRPGPEIIEGDLTIEPLNVHVISALSGESNGAEPAQIRDIKGTVDVPYARSRRWMFWVGWVLAIAALVNLIFIYHRWRSRRSRQIPQIEPGAWATQEFRRLEGDRLIEQRLFHDFYFRLSAIVREYIERRFHLMAPERTTDEFLREVRNNPALVEQHQDLLRGFLNSADQVKFALYEPSSEEAEKAFAAARDFVNETAYVPEVVVSTSPEQKLEEILAAQK